MVESGNYLWNAGMFVMSSATLDSELERTVPSLARAITAIAGKPGSQVAARYLKLSYDSFDREVVEKSRRVLGVRARFNWHDVGSWEGLRLALGGHHRNILRGDVVALDSNRVIAQSGKRLMVLFGVDDIVAIDTDDAVLVAHRSRSHELRRVSDELARRSRHKYL